MCNYFCIYLMHFSTNKRKKWDYFSALLMGQSVRAVIL